MESLGQFNVVTAASAIAALGLDRNSYNATAKLEVLENLLLARMMKYT